MLEGTREETFCRERVQHVQIHRTKRNICFRVAKNIEVKVEVSCFGRKGRKLEERINERQTTGQAVSSLNNKAVSFEFNYFFTTFKHLRK